MKEPTSLVDYMIALLLHDVGKAIFRDNDEFAAGHKFLLVDEFRRDHSRDILLNQNEIKQFVNHIPHHIINLIESHHESASTEKPWNFMDIAVVIADRLEKAMHQVTNEQGISYEEAAVKFRINQDDRASQLTYR